MSVQKIKTPSLNLAYEESGPKRGEPLLLVHGWPDSPRTWDGVIHVLHEHGYRTITPYLRGYSPTTFRDPFFGRNRRRTGQPVAFAQDMIDLANRLKLKRFHFIGHDWGARTGYALAALFPQRLKSLVTLSVVFQPGKPKPPKFPQARAYWYQWFLCTNPGEAKFRKDPIAYCKEQWDTWSPSGWYTPEDLKTASESWQGDDFEEVVLHSYRSRWGHAPLDPNYGQLQSRFESTLSLDTPTLLVQGAEDRCLLPETADGAHRYFTGGYQKVILDGVGHFPQRENARSTAVAILEHLRRYAGRTQLPSMSKSGYH